MDSLVILAEHLDKRPDEYAAEFSSSNSPGRFHTLFAKVSYHQRFVVCLVALFAAVQRAITNNAAGAVGCGEYVMSIVLVCVADICLWTCGSWADARGVRDGWSGVQWQCNTEELFKIAAGLTIAHMTVLTAGVLSAAGELSPPTNLFEYSSCSNYTLVTGAYWATALVPILYKLWQVNVATRCGVVRGDAASEEMQLADVTNDGWLYTRQRRARPRGAKRRRASSSGGGVAEDCAICLGQIWDRQRITTLRGCGHTFHSLCVQTWLGTITQSHQLQSCPLCRAVVDQSAVDQS